MTVRKETKPVSRRRVVQGIAWTTPAVVATVAAPAFAASLPCDPGTTWEAWLATKPLGITLLYADGVWTIPGPSNESNWDYAQITYTNGDVITVSMDGTPDPATAKGAGYDQVAQIWLDNVMDGDIYILDQDACAIIPGRLPVPEPTCDPVEVWTNYLTSGSLSTENYDSADAPRYRVLFDPDTGALTLQYQGINSDETREDGVISQYVLYLRFSDGTYEFVEDPREVYTTHQDESGAWVYDVPFGVEETFSTAMTTERLSMLTSVSVAAMSMDHARPVPREGVGFLQGSGEMVALVDIQALCQGGNTGGGSGS